jgi:hypothetical protein
MATLKLRFLVWAERKAEIRTRCDQPCRAYLEDVPDLLAAIDELEVRNAKLEAVAKVCREHVHGHPANCPGEMCKSLDALDALNHQ